jgi:hypothetical protein
LANSPFAVVDEAKLWSMADALRNNMDAAEYSPFAINSRLRIETFRFPRSTCARKLLSIPTLSANSIGIRLESSALPPPIYPSIQTAQKPSHWHPERVANSQEGFQCDWASCLDLLPVSGRKPVRDHVFLTKATFSPQKLYPLPQRPEEFLLIYHGQLCMLLRANSPRAD